MGKTKLKLTTLPRRIFKHVQVPAFSMLFSDNTGLSARRLPASKMSRMENSTRAQQTSASAGDTFEQAFPLPRPCFKETPVQRCHRGVCEIPTLVGSLGELGRDRTRNCGSVGATRAWGRTTADAGVPLVLYWSLTQGLVGCYMCRVSKQTRPSIAVVSSFRLKRFLNGGAP